MLVKGPKVVNAIAAGGRSGERRWIYGVNPILRRLEVDPTSVGEVRIADHPSRRLEDIVRLAERARVPVRLAQTDELRRLTQTASHQGVAALAAPVVYRDLDDALIEGAGAFLMLDQIQDPQNLGALLRTAAAVGIAAVLLPRHGSAPISPAVEKAAAGAVNDVPLCLVANLSQALRHLRDRGFWSIGLVAHGGENLFEAELPRPAVLVLGGESGMRPLVERHCEVKITIPVRESIESLNASVAGAIAMYDLVRRGFLTRP
jgi:23S rRNA (guanosine2251-2'-O)-methyltransferase